MIQETESQTIELINHNWLFKPEKENIFLVEKKKNDHLTLSVTHIDQDITHAYLSCCNIDSTDNYSIFADNKLVYIASILGDVTGNLEIQLVISGIDEENRCIYTEHIGLDLLKILNVPHKVKYINCMLRISGTGTCDLKNIQLNKFNKKSGKASSKAFFESENSDYLVLTNVYPEKNNLYRNMFVHRRAEIYNEKNMKVDVFRFNNKEKTLGLYKFENVPVYLGGKKELIEVLKQGQYKKILIHFVDESMIEAIDESNVKLPILVWIHGVETEKWYRRWFNFYQNSNDLSNALNNISTNLKRIEFMRSIYESEHLDIKFIFVSKWFKEAVAERDTGAIVKRYSIIHNVIDDEIFDFVEKNVKQRKKILSIRPFASLKYANDLTVKAILELSSKPYFNELEFNVYGRGHLFDETLEPLKKFSNVHLHNKFLTQTEIAALHKEHGLFLCPTRLDAQGVSMCEAMSSGLIPITNGVTAIPEFVNNECGFLADREDYKGLSKAIDYLYFHPEEFVKKSYHAATIIRGKCGKEKISREEIDVILG